jgi:hypothetical protein
MSREEQCAALSEAGWDEDILDGMSDEALAEAYRLTVGDEEYDEEGEPADMEEDAAAFAEKSVRLALAPIRRQLRKSARAVKRSRVSTFIESRRRARKILAAEVPALRRRLMRADDRRSIHQFKDQSGRQKSATELDLQMAEIDRRPAAPMDEEDEAQQASEFFNRYKDTLEKHGFTEASFVETFKNSDPGERRRLMQDVARIGKTMMD